MTFTRCLRSGLLGLYVLSFSSPAADVDVPELVIANTTVISPERSNALRNASVLVRNGRIVDVSGSGLSSAPGARVVDGKGLFLIPGLMDSHLHTTVIPGLGFRGLARARSAGRLTDAYERQLPRSLLYFGITQILDPAADPAGLKRLLARATRPDVLHCGAAPIVGGYPLLLLGPDTPLDAFPYIIDEPGSGRQLPPSAHPSRHTPEAVVRRIRDDGALCVKLFFENGWDLRNDWPMPRGDTIARVVREAHRLGLKVVGHANALDMQHLAMDAGVDVLAHGLWNWNQHRAKAGLPSAIRAHLDRIVERKTGYQPTLRVMDGMQAMFDPDMLEQTALTKVVPAELLAWYRTRDAQWFKRALAKEDFDGLPDARIFEVLGRPIGQGERALRYLADGRHPLLLASDHPANPGHANHPGYSTYLELAHMAGLGVPLRSIFEAATLNNARTFGVADRYGTVEPAKVANLLLLEANPLNDVRAYRKIKWVILRGRAIARESLAADYKELAAVRLSGGQAHR